MVPKICANWILSREHAVWDKLVIVCIINRKENSQFNLFFFHRLGSLSTKGDPSTCIHLHLPLSTHTYIHTFYIHSKRVNLFYSRILGMCRNESFWYLSLYKRKKRITRAVYIRYILHALIYWCRRTCVKYDKDMWFWFHEEWGGCVIWAHAISYMSKHGGGTMGTILGLSLYLHIHVCTCTEDAGKKKEKGGGEDFVQLDWSSLETLNSRR